MQGEGYARARGNDIDRAPAHVHKYFPLENLVIVSKPRSGKTTFLQWILMFAGTIQILRSFYTDVILISNATEEGTDSGWQWLRELYDFKSGSDVSNDGFLWLYGTMTTEIWAEQIVARRIKGLRLVICGNL